MTKKHILIAEDEKQARLSLSLILKGAGYGVAAVENGAQALAELVKTAEEGGGFDLLLTDIKMPGMDGVSLVNAIKERKLDVPSIAMTGFGDKDAVVQLLKAGCKDYLEKPLSADDVLRCVEKILAETEAAVGGGLTPSPSHDDASRLRRDIGAYKRRLDGMSAQFDSAVGAYHELVDIDPESVAIPFAWQNRPLAPLGGDFIGIDSRGNTHDVIVADVAGHDLGASFHTILIKAFFEENARQENDGATLFHLLNRQLLESGKNQRMVTALFLRIDLDAMTGFATTAGHPPLIRLPASSEAVDRLSSEGPVLGIHENAAFDSRTFGLGAGDRLFLYTDGVTSATRLDAADGRMTKLAESGLETILLSHRNRGFTDMVAAAWQDVLTFCDGKPDDDMLLAGLEIPETSPPSPPSLDRRP